MHEITRICTDNKFASYNGIPLVKGKTEDDLDRTFNAYQWASEDTKKHIDQISTFIYGEDNTQRYLRLKGMMKDGKRQVISLDDSIDNPANTIPTEDDDSPITFEGFFSELEIQQADFDDKPVKTGFIDNSVNRWNSLYYKGEDKYREKVETLIIKGDSVYLAFIDDNKYNIPGGSSEPNKTLSEQAVCECEEEAKIVIDNIRYFMTYDYDYTPEELKKQPRIMKSIPEDKRWIGKHIHLFVADYKEDYKGYVEKQDRDYLFTKNGKFYNIKKIFKKLRPEHQLALREMVIKNDLS